MTLTIPANDYGKVHVFQLDYQLEMEIGHMGDYDRLARALGTPITEPRDVQIVSEAALHDLGLAQFLMMGHGIAEADIAPDMERLNALKGSFAIIRSGAFGGAAVTVPDGSEATWIATYTEERGTAAPLTPLTSDNSKGTATPSDTAAKKPKSDARIGGMVATVALLLMGLLVWLMIWIGS